VYQGNGEDPTTLYRIFNKAGELIYIGITNNISKRLVHHASMSLWWPLKDRVETQEFVSRRAAEAAERAAIRAEVPTYNRCSVAVDERKQRGMAPPPVAPQEERKERKPRTINELLAWLTWKDPRWNICGYTVYEDGIDIHGMDSVGWFIPLANPEAFR
jgi:predicted GIY-YIG superfamily endonuclease